MGSADQDVSSGLLGVTEDGGGNPTTTPLPWRGIWNRCRYIIDTTLHKIPFTLQGLGVTPQAIATYDQVTVTAEQTAWRYVDSHGQVWDNVKKQLVEIEWMMDGAPPLTPAKLAQYVANANVLRPWPTGYAGALPGDPTQTYPVWPPVAPVAA